MIPALLGGLALRATAAPAARIIGTQFAKQVAKPVAEKLTGAVGRNISSDVAGRFVGMKATPLIEKGIKAYGTAQIYNAGMQAMGRTANFAKGIYNAPDQQDARQNLV